MQKTSLQLPHMPCISLRSTVRSSSSFSTSCPVHLPLAACSWAGLGSQGRWFSQTSPGNGNTWGAGLVWLCGEAWNSPPVYLHEMGHNVSETNLPRTLASSSGTSARTAPRIAPRCLPPHPFSLALHSMACFTARAPSLALWEIRWTSPMLWAPGAARTPAATAPRTSGP